MADRRPVSNPLALAVLSFLATRPMYPYELASVLRNSGKEQAIKINWGSLYTVVQNLHKHGLIEEAGTTRQGGRPERTAYAITDAGRAEMRDWLRELLAEPHREYPLFAAALSLIGALAPDEAIEALERRLAALGAEIAAYEVEAERHRGRLPRIFLIEGEYLNAMRRTESEWIRALLADLAGGAMPEVEMWEFHRTGRIPEEIAALLEEGIDE